MTKDELKIVSGGQTGVDRPPPKLPPKLPFRKISHFEINHELP